MGMFIKVVLSNLPTFFKVWGVVLIANQVIIFGACFAPYCLIAALPHTSIISAVITYLMLSSKKDESQDLNRNRSDYSFSSEEIEEALRSSNDTISKKKSLENNGSVELVCPKCSSKMVERTARRGRYAGNKFWGCSKYPKCNGIINK